MKTNLTLANDQIAAQAADMFDNGYHCAEAVVDAALKGLQCHNSDAVAHATAFGGGMGKSHGEACGALSGALIVIGSLHGRRAPGQNWDLPAHLGARLRSWFIASYGTTLCGLLRDRFGEACQIEECREIVRGMTRELITLLETETIETVGN